MQQFESNIYELDAIHITAQILVDLFQERTMDNIADKIEVSPSFDADVLLEMYKSIKNLLFLNALSSDTPESWIIEYVYTCYVGKNMKVFTSHRPGINSDWSLLRLFEIGYNCQNIFGRTVTQESVVDLSYPEASEHSAIERIRKMDGRQWWTGFNIPVQGALRDLEPFYPSSDLQYYEDVCHKAQEYLFSKIVPITYAYSDYFNRAGWGNLLQECENTIWHLLKCYRWLGFLSSQEVQVMLELGSKSQTFHSALTKNCKPANERISNVKLDVYYNNIDMEFVIKELQSSSLSKESFMQYLHFLRRKAAKDRRAVALLKGMSVILQRGDSFF